MNKAILVGRLTKDPDVRYTQTGKVVATFGLAIDRIGKEKETDFLSIVVWGRMAEICGDNLTKGRKVLVDGRIQVRNYEDKTGQKRYVTEIIAQSVEFLDGKASTSSGKHKSDETVAAEMDPDSEIPF